MLPNLILLITLGLQQIKKGGTIYLFMRNGQLNNTIKKMIYLLCSCFKSYKIHRLSNNLVYLIELKIFKDNISNDILEKLCKICINTRNYNYSLCQFMEYYYNLLTTKSDNNLGYELDLDTFTMITLSVHKMKKE